ncbi:MAG TPA: hypothetical protein VGX91_07675 [Candidatus Cybelea sp.]|jgi:hypothetical protein|nr:hypothetical protein [Candidatus Cybelea sp.]
MSLLDAKRVAERIGSSIPYARSLMQRGAIESFSLPTTKPSRKMLRCSPEAVEQFLLAHAVEVDANT